ncbi:MAG: ribose-phosphate pyrophosphokinase [Clostridia bacterium]|nr:ribose-phosphate pyrophosphokinase [Clostridia bacterium]
MKSEVIFHPDTSVAPLGMIALESAKDLGEKIDGYLVKWAKERNKEPEGGTFRIEAACPRFSSGDAKGMIKSTVRGKDLFILVDVANYNCTYNMFGMKNQMSPDDHFQDLKRIIQAASGKAHRVNVIMPSLYGGRQHKRSYRESMDCAVALQELQNMGVENIVTFDAHDPRVHNAVPLMGFDNIMPSYQVLKTMFKTIEEFKPNKDNFMVISPDEGAINRNMYYASVLGVDLGLFYKRRDYSVIVNGRNPIVAHEYLGNSVEGKDVFIADDIISSGESMLDIAYELKKRKANRIFCYATYAIFTNGLETFDKAFENGVIDGVYGTNLTYRSPELLNRKWFHEVDMSKYIAYFVAALNHDISVSLINDPHEKIQTLLKKHGLK